MAMFKKTFITSLLFSVLFIQNGFAQKEGNIWYFGNLAGLDFNSGSPVPLTNGVLNTAEGCATIADANGSLLFYTDGSTIWNKNHVPMPNGSGLLGNSTSTQAGIIIKQPGNPNLYYVFSIFTDFAYSVVDITLQGGDGDVVAGNKNIVIAPGVNAEKQCATKHANGNDVWITMHEYNTNGFRSYLLTSAGLTPVPVVSNVGVNHNTGQYGQMKFNPQGTKIACGIVSSGIVNVQIMDFDNLTGIVSNEIAIPNGSNQCYGLEFSPNGSLLYATTNSGTYIIYQYDLNAGSAAAVIASQTQIGSTVSYDATGMQLGPDNKVYIAPTGSGYLDVINDPDVLGTGCNFVHDAVYLQGRTSALGLPEYISNLFSAPPHALFSAPNHICPGTCTNFNNLSQNGTSFLWTFAGANPGISTDVNPTNICYNSPGSYAVSLIATNINGSDTITLNNYITVYPYPAPQGISQSGDTLIANQGAISYQWYQDGTLIPGATEYFYVAQGSGDFNVVATDNNGCEVEAVIFDVIAGMNNPEKDNLLFTYPNPVEDKLFINCQLLSGENAEVLIYDMLGEKVTLPPAIPGNAGIIMFDVSMLPKGMYWVEISNGKISCRNKFLKYSSR